MKFHYSTHIILSIVFAKSLPGDAAICSLIVSVSAEGRIPSSVRVCSSVQALRQFESVRHAQDKLSREQVKRYCFI
jgi:hypothetical protein